MPITVNEYCKRKFGQKLYKLSLDGGMTCPNRDGKCGTRGCIFCSAGGSGDFTPSRLLSMDEQIEDAKKRIASKFTGDRFIAYFQAYTNTYAPADKLRGLFMPVIKRDDVAVLDIATRPDCLPDDVLDLIRELNEIKPVWVELGLQTVKESTAEYIRRGYPLRVYEESASKLLKSGVHVVTHTIIGLPGENAEDAQNTARFVSNCGSSGIKLQLLHVLKGTDLADEYFGGKFNTFSTLEEYTDVLEGCLDVLRDDMVIHRLTGDGPKSLLISPMWSADKKRVLNRINTILKERNIK